MQIKRYLADSSAISKTQGYRSPEGGRYSPWGGPIRFGRSIEERLGNHFQFILEKARKKPNTETGSNRHGGLTGGQHPLRESLN